MDDERKINSRERVDDVWLSVEMFWLRIHLHLCSLST